MGRVALTNGVPPVAPQTLY